MPINQIETKFTEDLPNLLGKLSTFVQLRIQQFFDKSDALQGLPGKFSWNGKALMSDDFEMEDEGTLVLLLSIAPHIQPHFFDEILQGTLPKAGDFPQLGGARGKNHRGFLPTGETALFLVAGDDLEKRLAVQHLFSEDHLFAKKRILWLEEVPEGEPRMSGRIILSQEYVDLFTIGKVAAPRFSMTFPAQRIETELEWDDLVLHPDTLEQIKELEVWVKHGDTLMDDWGMRRKLKPGYRALFHGPPGTGKTLTASLLGKYTGKEVYRIDLSMVVSKYIGETEKNLSNLFAKAENKNWILFFDEADALFGKRTNVRDAHDKYANQEVSYLLQRVELYDGLVILATNFKSNIDEAFSRRFQSIIYFPIPGVEERIRLWNKAFPAQVKRSPDINLPTLAQKYELTGAEIINIIQYACLRVLEREESEIRYADLYEGIKKEFQKEGRILR
jgi:AAA+ superfamily predicted ATPase